MHQMFQQIEPPKKSFMEQAGWQIIIIIASMFAGIVGTIIIGIWQGTTHVIDFNWLVLIFIGLLFGIVVYCVIYVRRTREQLQEKYIKDITNAKNDFLKYKTETMNLRAQESEQWNSWAISFTQASAREQKERLEEVEKRCMEAIQGAEQRLDVNMKNAMSLYKTAQETTGIIIDQYRDQLIQAQKQMQALEERLRKELQLDATDPSSDELAPFS